MGFYRALTFAGVSLLAISTPAFSQVSPPAPNTQPNAPGTGADTGNTADATIVVQARRRDEALQDVPLVVNAVTAATLQKDNIHQFTDITTVVPGLSLVPNANGIGSSSSMRGVNHDVNVSANNGTIQYYMNDAPIASDTIFQTMFDVDSIDVERGPQGTLRGRSAPSGAIAITTHQPNLEEPGAYVDGTAASHSTYNVNFGIGVPVIKDILAVRVAGVYDFNRGNDVYSVNSSIPPSNTTKSLRASVRFEPTDWLKSAFSFTTINHENISYDQAASFSLVDPTVASTAGAPDYGTITPGQRKSVEFNAPDSLQKIQRYDWHLRASFAGQSLIYVGSHEHTTYDVTSNNDSGGQLGSLPYTQLTLSDSVVNTHEIRLQNDTRIAGIFDYVVGYFRDTQAHTTNLEQPAAVELFTNYTLPPAYGGGTIVIPLPGAYAPGGTNPFVTDTAIEIPTSHTKEESFYGNLTAHLGSNTEVSAGVRHIKYTDPGQSLYANEGGTLIQIAQPVSASGKPTIYTASATHHFSDTLMAYVSTGSSWRPAGNAIGDFSLVQTPLEQTFTHSNPETSKNYEIGMKSQWLDRKILFDITYFHQNFKNYPFRLAGNGTYYLDYVFANGTVSPTVAAVNFISGVPVAVNGVESEIAFRPSHNFSIDASIDWTKSRLGGSAVIPCDNLPYNVTPTVGQLIAALPAGQHIAACSGAGLSGSFQPEWSGTVTAEYTATLKGQMEGFLRGVATLRGSSQNDPLNPYDNVGAYALLNAYLGIRDNKAGWSLMLYGKNLGNVEKITTLNGQPSALSVNNVNVTPGAAAIPASNLVSQYGGVTITNPREFGVNLRIAFGSR